MVFWCSVGAYIIKGWGFRLCERLEGSARFRHVNAIRDDLDG